MGRCKGPDPWGPGLGVRSPCPLPSKLHAWLAICPLDVLKFALICSWTGREVKRCYLKRIPYLFDKKKKIQLIY